MNGNVPRRPLTAGRGRRLDALNAQWGSVAGQDEAPDPQKKASQHKPVHPIVTRDPEEKKEARRCIFELILISLRLAFARRKSGVVCIVTLEVAT